MLRISPCCGKLDVEVLLQPFAPDLAPGQHAQAGDARIADRGIEHEIALQQGQLRLFENLEACGL